MNKVKAYFLEINEELVKKTSWPSWMDLQRSAVVVAVSSVIISLVIFGMDKLISEVLKIVYDLFK
ncbi:preprotein translocase subunit SecE [bacterium]|nr:preprotein translocase subunit SecE [bacterium]